MLLHISKHDQSVFLFPLDSKTQSQVTIGRGLDNDIILTDQMVSKHHLILKPEIQGWSVHDQTDQGVQVNDEISSRAEIIVGTQIKIGPYVIQAQKNKTITDDTLATRSPHETQT